MKICLVIFAVLSLSQGFPRPSVNNYDPGNKRQGVHYGYPETPEEHTYTSDQATAFSQTPPFSTSLSKPEQDSAAAYYNTAADKSSTSPSPYAAQSQTADRQAEASQPQYTQSQTQADQSSAQKTTSPNAAQSQTADNQAANSQAQSTQSQTQADQSSAQKTATTSPYATQSQAADNQAANTQAQDTQSQTQADQSSAQKTATASPYPAAQSQTADNQGANSQAQSAQSQTQADQYSAQKTATASPYADSQSQTTSNAQAENKQTQTSAQTQPPTSQTQDSPSTASQNSTSQSQAPQTSSQASTYQTSSSKESDPNAPTSTAPSTQNQASQDATSSTQASNQTPQSQDASTSSSQPQTQTQAAQDQTSSQSNASKQNNEYVNSPQPYNADQNNPQSSTSSQTATDSKSSNNPQGYDTPDNTQYKIENVTSKTVSGSNQASAGAPVYLSSAGTANIADSSNPNDNKKSAPVSKETTVNGNHATTYLELPKIIHKPAIVKYQVQIAPKVKGVPIEQEIAIMPPEGSKGAKKPLVLLKQVVSKPTAERIQVIIPKSESGTVSSPKVEVKGGHVDQEALNGKDRSQSQYQDQGQYQQGQTQGQSESEYQGQTQDRSPSQYQGQTQDQTSQYQGQYQDQYQDYACRDHNACKNYNPNMCNQVWMKRHCKKMCGLCTPPEEETLSSTSSGNATAAPKHCKYGGIIHQSGETWSPGSCVPKCHCDNGNIKCSKLECPDLNCDKPIKRRWKCCPECLPDSDKETRCGVETKGGNAESLCCVFPFNYRGVDYFTCTTTDAQDPWCSITRNYDRDGLWGNCVVKSEGGKKHVKQADSDEKTALVLAKQLSSARKWRNSTNNQVTDALKAVPNPMSEDELQKLKAVDTSYTDTKNAYQNALGASDGLSTQTDYYKNAGVDISKVNALNSALKNRDYNRGSYNGAYQENSTSYASQSQSSPPIPSDQGVNNDTSVSSNYYAQPTGDPYSNYSYQTATRNDGYSSEAAGKSSDPQRSDYRVSNTAGSNAVGYNTVGYNTTESNTGGYNSGVFNTGDSNAVGSDTRGSNAVGSNTVESNTGGITTGVSFAGQSNTDPSNQYKSYYPNTNTPSATSAYSSSYAQQSTSKDTTDNTVPNGIENQTSYEMNPDASTAQYGNGQPATT